MLRKNEHRHLTGLAFYLTGSLLSILWFEKILAIVCILFLILGDTFAAITGVALGRRRLFKKSKKSIEGSLSCFAVCSLIGFVFLPSNFDLALSIALTITGAVTATVTEYISSGVYDNLTVPLISGVVMTTVVALL